MKSKLLKKATALLICTALVFSISPCVNAAWDGYPKPKTGEDMLLVDNNNISNIIAAKAKPATKNVKNGERYSAHWNNHTVNTTLSYSSVERDWSMCNTVCFDIFSQKATNASIVFMVYTDYVPTPGKTISYLSKSFKLDFEGWKHIELNMNEFTNGNFGDWAKVQSVSFIASGWGATPHEDSDIYISSVYGNVGEASEAESSIVENMELSDKEKQPVFSALNENIAVMNFAGNVIKDGKIVPINVKNQVTTDESGTIAPVSFFEDILGATVDTNNGKIVITLDNKTADLTSQVKNYDGVSYLALKDTLTALGKTSEQYSMVTFIGDTNKNTIFKEDAKLMRKLEIMLNANALSEEDVSKEDWQYLKDKWRKCLLGDEAKDLSDKTMADKLRSIDKSCEGHWKTMVKNNSVLALFGNTGVTATTNMTNEYAKLYTMARAYGTYGCENYKNPKLKRDILYGLKWLNENLYGQDIIDGKGWKSIYDYDWWDWFVGTPTALGEILLIMEQDLNPKLIEKYLAPFEKCVRLNLRTALNPDCAASRVYVCTLSSALREDFDSMKGMVIDYNLMLTPAKDGPGVQEDGLYLTHEYFAYSSAYGSTSLLDRLTKVESILSGTSFEFATPNKYNSCKWMYEMFAPIIFNGAITSSLSGRFRDSGQFTETSYSSYAIAAMLDFIGAFGKDDDIKLKQLIKRNIIEDNKTSIISRLEVDQVSKLMEVLEDTSIPEEPYYISRVYYTGDSVVHQRDDFGFALAMSSSRIAGWESISGVNMKGWYQGDGMLYTYVDNDSQAYNLNYWRNANPYHLPGTTVDTQERVEASIGNSAEALAKQDFVGGVNLDDLYSMAAMQLQTHNCDNKNANVVKIAPGGDAPYHKSSLIAKKAYFMFDDEAVALGADINAGDGYEVQTVVENRRLNETQKLVKDGNSAEKKVYDVIKATASSDDGNIVQNTLDSNYETRWSAQGDAEAIYELEEAVPIGYVGIAQYNGTGGKQAIFELETSLDGENWTKIYEGKASGTTTSMEPYDMKGTVAKYVKYSGHGRTNSEWNSVTEVKIFAPTSDGSMPVDGEVTDDKILGSEDIIVDGTLLEKASTYKKSFNNPSYVHLEGTGGYFFPQGGKLVMDKVTNKENFLEMWLSHDVSPKKGTYSYVVLPKKSVEETAAYAQNSDIEILSNNEKLQAVREKTLGITGMVFWQAGSFENITTSQPIMVMTKKHENEFKVNISDPTKLLTEGKITISGNYTLVECDERLSVVSDGEKTEITINFEGSKGKTLPVVLKVN